MRIRWNRLQPIDRELKYFWTSPLPGGSDLDPMEMVQVTGIRHEDRIVVLRFEVAVTEQNIDDAFRHKTSLVTDDLMQKIMPFLKEWLEVIGDEQYKTEQLGITVRRQAQAIEGWSASELAYRRHVAETMADYGLQYKYSRVAY